MERKELQAEGTSDAKARKWANLKHSQVRWLELSQPVGWWEILMRMGRPAEVSDQVGSGEKP